MFRIKRRRTLVRIISFTLAALTVTTSLAIYSSWLAYSYRRSIEYSYQRALSELAVHVNSIDLGLQKGMYAGTSTQLAGVSAQIWRDAGAAKSDLAQIPLYDNHLDNTYKFISQVGDYANSLTRNVSATQSVTDGDREKMKSLSSFAKKLSQQLNDMLNEVYSGKITIFTTNDALKSQAGKEPQGQTNVDTGLKDIENNFSSMPSLIYDGPFSDNVLKKQPTYTQGKPMVARAKAKQTAAAFLGLAAGALKDSGETAGNLPTYNFTAGSIAISVTKAGGFVARMLDSRAVGMAKLNNGQSRQKGREFLNAHKIGSMKESYYQTNNDICVINYAFVQGDVTCYPDLVKVAVALDNGSVVSFDATGFLMNHKQRSLAAPKVSADAVKKLVSPYVKAQSVGLVVIPREDATEGLCYEVKCKGQSGQDVLDYFDTATGREVQLLILIQTPGGVLAS